MANFLLWLSIVVGLDGIFCNLFGMWHYRKYQDKVALATWAGTGRLLFVVSSILLIWGCLYPC